MRRTLTVVLGTLLIALPLCAQHRGFARHIGGSAPHYSNHPTWGSRPMNALRGGVGFRGSFGSGASFGHNRFSVFVGPQQFHHRHHWMVYPYRYYYSAVYPYFYYPAYPLAYYDAFDYTDIPAQPSYASGSDNYPPEVGLAEQMRQQGVGIYAQPQPPTASYPNRAPGVDRSAPYPQRAPVATAPATEQPTTALVYRDGHTTDVRNYAVVGQTLWIFSEDRAQKVPLSQLDIDATRKANEQRGIEFLPPR